MNEDLARGGDFAEQLSLLIFSIFFFKFKYAFLEHRGVASSKLERMWVWLVEECANS